MKTPYFHSVTVTITNNGDGEKITITPTDHTTVDQELSLLTLARATVLAARQPAHDAMTTLAKLHKAEKNMLIDQLTEEFAQELNSH